MKILYGVQGTGNGHITRARMMAKAFTALNDPDIKIDFLFSGRKPEDYFEMECFGECRYYRGLTFTTEAGKIKHLQTVLNNNAIQFIKEIRSLDVSAYDLIITDFEPLTAWAGKLSKVPVIGLGHQYAFGHNIPLAGYTPVAALIMRYFAPADIKLGLHWDAFGHTILPPIIDHDHHRSESNHAIMVYLPFEDQQLVSALLNSIKGVNFIQYSSALTDGEQGNVLLRKASHTGFKRDLAASQGVICNAGFELVSECLHMGIPTLVKPVQGQFEQQSNAAALTQLGYGQAMNTLDKDLIVAWLNKKPAAPAISFHNTAQAIAKWLQNTPPEQYHQGAEQLTRALWNDTAETIASASNG